MSEYVITSDCVELPRGTCFTVWPCEVEPGQLAMFAIGDRVSIGRWMPDICGIDWIRQPLRLIACVDCHVRILGVVVPVEPPPAEVGDLTNEERATALRIARKLKGATQ